MFASLAQQGIHHAEVFVAVGGLLVDRPHVSVDAVFAAIESARAECEVRYGISVLWIVDAPRGFGAEHVSEVFGKAAKLRERFLSVVGVGIGGDKVRGPCRLFRDAYLQAKESGLRLTAHCGEATGRTQGTREIWDALDIGVERLGHAFCAQYDEALLDELRRRGTVLELNVTSNWRTGICQSLRDHSIETYVKEWRLQCTINSDDPAMFGSNLLQEYILIHDKFGFSSEDMRALASNSFRFGDDRKAYLVDLVAAYE